MAQGTGSHRTSPTHRRRGTVLILVISVLAMLFILGTSQLMMARYARKLADERATGTQAKDTVASSVVPTADGVAADVRGTDFVPYNSSWNRALNNGSWSVVEQPGADNSADFPGYVDHRDVPNNPNYNSLLSPAQDRIRNGDLLLSSLEPYQTNVNGSPGWAYFAMTWSQNTPATSSLPPAPFTVSGASTSKSAPLANPALGSFYDVSGSGVFDGQQVGSMASCDLYQRVICHGGMVLLDRMTHPSLLKQVIHPNDGYANQPWALFGLGVWNGIKYNKSNPQDPTNGLRDDGIRAADEGRMRRRFMLPGSEIVNSDAWKNLPLGDLRTLLPYTLGYLAPSGDQYGPKDEKGNYLPHYWRVGSPPAGVNMSAQAEKDWYESRIVPGPAMNENYVAANDTYDRRHLITMFSNDDLLRPNRDEMGLFLNPSAAVPTWLRPFYYLIAPTATAERDSSFGSYAGFTTQTPTFTSDPANGIRVPAYGMVGDTLLFNTPGLRTQFSLRDVLVSPVSNSVVVEDPTYQNSDNPFWLPPDTYGAQASYKRAMQLTAYYLAMLQHTAQGVDRSATPWTPLMLSPEEQLRQAAQLAVNTIDFADSDSIPTKLVIKYLDAMGAEQTITVLGVEKQPYITEIYAKVAEVYDPDGKKRPDPDFPSRDASIHAVEIYNPYDTQISLRGYKLVSNGKPYPLKDLKDSNGTTPHDYIAPHSVLILSNQDASWSDSTGSNLPFDGNATSVATGEFVIKVDADFKVGAVTQLINTQALQLDATSVNPIFKTGEAIIVDQININAADGTTFVLDMPFNVDPSICGEESRAHFAADLNLTGQTPPITPAANKTYWRHTSVQRHKEKDPGNPLWWHFALARQAAFESKIGSDDPAVPGGSSVTPVHSLMRNTGSQIVPVWAWPGYIADNDVAASWKYDLVAAANDATRVNILNAAERFHNFAPMPIFVSDAGLDLSPFGDSGLSNLQAGLVGTAAFPTTGSLLLVTRNGHLSFNGADYSTGLVPMTVNAANAHAPANPSSTEKPNHQQWDFNHMPVWSVNQKTLDLIWPGAGEAPQGRFDVPWGQMVFHYFTALPLEELTNVDKFYNVSEKDFEDNYIRAFGFIDGSNPLYSLSPMVERVPEKTTYGPRVRGRVNINFAPWWVMDGLPVLPAYSLPAINDDYGYGPVYSPGSRPVATVPVPELSPRLLDPLDRTGILPKPGPRFSDFATLDAFKNAVCTRPGQYLSACLFDESMLNPAQCTVGANFARAMVAYRERRKVDYNGGAASVALTSYPDYPGFTTVGAVCDVVQKIPLNVMYGNDSVPGNVEYLRGYVDMNFPKVQQIQDEVDPSIYHSVDASRLRPFAYLGFAQMIAPVVRLQDWATVRSHVFTVYNLVGDGNGTWLRSQSTIDRTRCLYTNDLPDRITQQEPINYYNVINDQ